MCLLGLSAHSNIRKTFFRIGTNIAWWQLYQTMMFYITICNCCVLGNCIHINWSIWIKRPNGDAHRTKYEKQRTSGQTLPQCLNSGRYSHMELVLRISQQILHSLHISMFKDYYFYRKQIENNNKVTKKMRKDRTTTRQNICTHIYQYENSFENCRTRFFFKFVLLRNQCEYEYILRFNCGCDIFGWIWIFMAN